MPGVAAVQVSEIVQPVHWIKSLVALLLSAGPVRDQSFEGLACSWAWAAAGALRWGAWRWRGAPRGADWERPLAAAGTVRPHALLRASSTASCAPIRSTIQPLYIVTPVVPPLPRAANLLLGMPGML